MVVLKGTILVTGMATFMGSWVVEELLKTKEYKIRGTISDLRKTERIDALKAAFGEWFLELEIVEADMLDSENLDKAVQGCDYVIHLKLWIESSNRSSSSLASWIG